MKRLLIVLMFVVFATCGCGSVAVKQNEIIGRYCVEGHEYAATTAYGRIFLVPIFNESGLAKACEK